MKNKNFYQEYGSFDVYKEWLGGSSNDTNILVCQAGRSLSTLEENLFMKIKYITTTIIISVLIAIMHVFIQAPTAQAATSSFSDVPSDSWAISVINAAAENGLMEGESGGKFGYGKTMTNAEFITVLCRMFAWELTSPTQPAYVDVNPGDWFYRYVETAAAHGILEGGINFSPNTPIIRENMAGFLIRSLGYKDIALKIGQTMPPMFSDTSNAYVNIAATIGMINGVGDGKFAPLNTAKREEAAAMLVRVYEKLKAKIEWNHGFYALSSYNQREVIANMNAVTFGWSAMEWSADRGVLLNTSASGGNQWRIPDSYELIADTPRQHNATANLGVFMDAAMGLASMLQDATARHDAINEIVQEATRAYSEIGRSPYNGVTIDFEGLRAASKNNFTAFLTELSAALHDNNRTLFVAVQPATIDGVYFDGYDYREIGKLADKIILMAYNYHPLSMDGFIGTEWEKNAALTPIAEIYQALKSITDPTTGVEDKGKIALGISYANVGWKIDDNDKVVDSKPVSPSLETVNTRMSQPDTIFGWSESYRNPYIIYKTENGERIFLWYENSRSVEEKLALARFFGVTGASIWRIGIIPSIH